MADGFIDDLRRLHSEALKTDWDAHLAGVNAQYGFIGDHALSTADAGIPPAWFNGDVEAIRPGDWVLVVSLNPAKPPAGYYRGELTSETAWDFWRTHNTRWWYTRFFRPLVRLASTALGEEAPVLGPEERRFATERMVFVELCPYASKRFSLDTEVLVDLGRNDIGFGFAQHVRQILLEQARPSLVLVNGEEAVKDFAVTEAGHLDWRRQEYSSVSAPSKSGRPKSLWHYEGWYRAEHASIPVGGFKFLRKPANHNSYAEIDQLGQALRSSFEEDKPDPN
jgi:hypothetical protein